MCAIMDSCTLNKGTVDVWLEELSSSTLKDKVQHVLLNHEETTAANNFYFEKDRENYKVSHQFLRFILSCYLKISPNEINFTRMTHGKPIVFAQKPYQIEFNMAHTNNFLAVAIGKNHSVGVDIETMTDKNNVDALAKHCFSAEEFKQYSELSENLRPRAFFRGWSRKEAYLKALGTGLNKDLRSFSINIFDDKPHAPIVHTQLAMGEKQWLIQPINLAESYNCAAAVVINNNIKDINYRSLSLAI